MESNDEYPRELSPQERELLLWVLPPDRPGFGEYRKAVEQLSVRGQGRRGAGNFILAPVETLIDRESPLPQVIAYGVVESDEADVAVTVREFLGPQLEYEIMNLKGATVPKVLNENRRWTFSDWLPGRLCPICANHLREVTVALRSNRTIALALCVADKRIWVYDSESGINHLIPVTNFCNELMLHRRIRDPKTALNPARLFGDLSRYSDRDLVHAFQAYNQIKTKVQLEMVDIAGEEKQRSFMKRLLSTLTRRSS